MGDSVTLKKNIKMQKGYFIWKVILFEETYDNDNRIIFYISLDKNQSKFKQ